MATRIIDEYIVLAEYNNGTSYPVSGFVGNGLNVDNTGAASLTITLTFTDSKTLTITVPANTAYYDYFKEFDQLDTGGSSTSYLIQVKGRQ